MWQDKIEWLPDGSKLLVMDIKAMKDGKPFRWWPVGCKKAVEMKPVGLELFNYYYNFYENTRLFGLPSGKGWQHESPYGIKVLRKFFALTEVIKDWLQRESAKNAKS
jgi:hypothetical protein